MKYYHLIFDYNGSSKFIDCAKVELNNKYKYEIDSGKETHFRDGEILITYKSDTGILPDYLNNNYAWLIISNRCKKIFEENINPGEIQFVNVILKDLIQGTINTSYYIANIVNVLDAIDLENAEYNVYCTEDTEVLAIRKYAVIEEKIKGQIFKLKDSKFAKFVSEKVMKSIKKEKLTGFSFTEIKGVSKNY